MNQLLTVEHLSVTCETSNGRTALIEDAGFHIDPGEIVVLLGESGSGKTVLSRALTRLFPNGSTLQTEGSVQFNQTSIHRAAPKELIDIRRTKLRYIFQEPAQALNPLADIRSQMELAGGGSRSPERLRAALASVGISNAEEVLRLHPHQLSVGMAQRVMIAMAMLPSPSLLIADEPTSALDASLRFQLLDLLASIQAANRLSILLITHDLDVARLYGDRVIVLYAGRIVEVATREAFFEKPLHPYGQALLASRPTAGASLQFRDVLRRDNVDTAVPQGCRFSARCDKMENTCIVSEPPLEKVAPDREVRCYFWK